MGEDGKIHCQIVGSPQILSLGSADLQLMQDACKLQDLLKKNANHLPRMGKSKAPSALIIGCSRSMFTDLDHLYTWGGPESPNEKSTSVTF